MILRLFLIVIAGWFSLGILTQGAEFWRLQVFRWRFSHPSRARGGILFTGSSSIRRWRTLARDMAPLQVINRGFGGAHIPHLIYFAKQIFARSQPEAVVICAGENDLAAGRTPERVAEDFRAFANLVQTRYRVRRIYFISIKPSPLRRRRWDAIRQANALIRDWIQHQTGISFIDTNSQMLTPTGQPRRELWGWDGIHLSAEGYAAWTSAIRPLLLANGMQMAEGATP